MKDIKDNTVLSNAVTNISPPKPLFSQGMSGKVEILESSGALYLPDKRPVAWSVGDLAILLLAELSCKSNLIIAPNLQN